MKTQYDVIIIGAGIIGCCVAFELAKSGKQTLSIDKLPEAGHGSTSSSSAIIRTYYSAFETCALAYEGWHYWKDWERYIGPVTGIHPIRYNDIGSLVVKTPENNHLETVCRTMDQLGCPYEHIQADDIAKWLPAPDLNRFAPAKKMDEDGFGEATGGKVAGAVFFPTSGYVSDPKLAAQNVQKAAIAHGAEFRFNAQVAEIRRTDGRISGVTLTGGDRIDAPVVVNVGGPYSSAVNRMAGVAGTMKMTTRALRREVAQVPAPQGVNFEKDGVVFCDIDIAVYARPEVGNNIQLGSTEPDCDPLHWVDDPDNYNDAFSEEWQTMVMRLAQRIPSLGIPGQAAGTVALYDVTEDWMPIYDKSDLPGYYMAVGTSGNQFKNAPVVGKLMAALIDACENGRDHDREPLTFELKKIGHTISLQPFSRNRDVNENSSFSVLG